MKESRKKIVNVVLALLSFVVVVFLLSILLKKLGINDQQSLQTIIKKTGAWGPIVFFILQVLITTLLSVIPGTSLMFLILSGIIFDNIWLALSISLLGVWTSSILMFFIGNTLGEKAAIKLVGRESMEKAQDLIDTKTKVYLPIMFLFPFFPDDALCLAAGLTKVKYSYFIPVVLLFRSTGVIAAVLSSFYNKSIIEYLGFSKLVPIEWFILINVIAFNIYVIFKFTRWLEKKINESKKNKENNELE